MSGPTFTPSSTAGLYWLQEPALPSEYGIALLPADPRLAVSSLDLAESWTAHPGLYLMTATKPLPAAEAAFALAARTVWSWLGAGARFVWVTDSTGQPGSWDPQAVWVRQSPGAAAGALAGPAQLVFGMYALGLGAQLAVGLAADGFTLSGDGFSLATPAARWRLTGGSGTVLSFAGAGAGCLALSLALPQQGGAPAGDYEQLDVALRMAVDSDVPEWQSSGALRSLRYPLFSGLPAAGASFSCGFDPARPTDPARSRLAFSSLPAHTSRYRGPLGHPVTLTPQAAAGDPLPAGLAFHRRPPVDRPLPDADPLYLAPIGRYALGLDPRDARLAAGLSGYESFSCEDPSGAVVVFAPGQPAYAQRLTGEAAGGVVEMSAAATCPYATVAAAAAAKPVVYHAQPRRSALHRVREAGPADLDPYLVYLDVPAGQATAAAPGPYPLLPYAGAEDEPELLARLEAQALAPRRREALAGLQPPPSTGTTTATTAATTRGLVAGFGPGLVSWESLQFAASPASAAATAGTTVLPPLEIHALTPKLRSALLTEELFLVVADPTCLQEAADFNYLLSTAALRELADMPAAGRPSTAALKVLHDNVGLQAQGWTAFALLLKPLLGTEWAASEAAIREHCAYFEIEIEGWRFPLSPSLWQSDAETPTLMIAKFASGKVRSLASDPGAWTWSEAAEIGGSTEKAATALSEIIEQADKRVKQATSGKPSPLEFFVDRVLDDPSWNGVLFLNPLVALDDLPDELRGLAAGIKAESFRAHHLGASIGPVTVPPSSHSPAMGPTPFFGLIDYEDPEDIQHTFDDFDFKVLSLRVLFERSQIADFSSRIELFVNRLFGDGLQLAGSEHYNNLLLDGSYQRTPGGGHYVFVTTHASRFESESPVLASIEVDTAQFNTMTAGDTVSSRFTLWGKLRFQLLEGLDLFSFGPAQPSPLEPPLDGWLSYAGLAIDMSFPSGEPGKREFGVDIGSIGFDGASSSPREESLYRRFPLQVSGMVRAEPGTRPRDLGFLAVHAPLAQPTLDGGWHGLLFTLDLGSLGALAADAGLSATLLAAWGPAAGGLAANVALKLPGVESVGQFLPLEGVLEMGFAALDLSAGPAPGGGPAYALRMKRFYLRLLGWQFPPGQADITLFGDPDVAAQPVGGRRGSLGWYAGYRGPEKKG